MEEYRLYIIVILLVVYSVDSLAKLFNGNWIASKTQIASLVLDVVIIILAILLLRKAIIDSKK